MLAFAAIVGYSLNPSPVNTCFSKSGKDNGLSGFGVFESL